MKGIVIPGLTREPIRGGLRRPLGVGKLWIYE